MGLYVGMGTCVWEGVWVHVSRGGFAGVWVHVGGGGCVGGARNEGRGYVPGDCVWVDECGKMCGWRKD